MIFSKGPKPELNFGQCDNYVIRVLPGEAQLLIYLSVNLVIQLSFGICALKRKKVLIPEKICLLGWCVSFRLLLFPYQWLYLTWTFAISLLTYTSLPSWTTSVLSFFTAGFYSRYQHLCLIGLLPSHTIVNTTKSFNLLVTVILENANNGQCSHSSSTLSRATHKGMLLFFFCCCWFWFSHLSNT